MLSSEIQTYIDSLRKAIPSIESIWLLGSRANGTARENSDWDFIIFASDAIINQIAEDPSLHREDVDLLVVDNSDAFTDPFGRQKSGTLQSWKWNQVTEKSATYESVKWVDDNEADSIDDEGRMVIDQLNAYLI